MNKNYSKNELILIGVRKLLVDDNTNTGAEVREIQFYCEDRIYRTDLNHAATFPQILMEIDSMDSSILIPTSKFILTIKICIKRGTSGANMVLDRMATRVEYLLNRQHEKINIAADLAKNLRCRMIRKISAIRATDMIMDIITEIIMFEIVLDDEILTIK